VDVKPWDVGKIVQLAITSMKEGSAKEEEALEKPQASETHTPEPSQDNSA
jgi:hypothetical protein